MRKEWLQKKIRYMFQETAVPFTTAVPGTGSVLPSANEISSAFAQFFSQDFSVVFTAFFKIAIAAGAILAVLRLGYGGFMYMVSDVWSKKDTAKKIIQETVLGLALLLAIWVILFQIYPGLLNLDIFKVPTDNKITPTEEIDPKE